MALHPRARNLNFATDINQAPESALGCSGYNCGNPNPVFNNIAAQIYDGYSNYNAPSTAPCEEDVVRVEFPGQLRMV